MLMFKYRLPIYILFIFCILISAVSAAEPESIILQNNNTDLVMGDLLVFLSFMAVISAIIVILKIVLMMQDG